MLFYKCKIHLTELIKDMEIPFPGILKIFQLFHKIQTVFAPLPDQVTNSDIQVNYIIYNPNRLIPHLHL